MNAVIRMHSALMQKYPWKTVAFSTGFVMSTGDAISQKFVERNEKFDCKRYVRYWAFGVIIAGPLFHGWYIRLQTIFGKSKLAPFKMVAVDQLVFAPVFPPFFLGVMGLMKGDSFSIIKQKNSKGLSGYSHQLLVGLARCAVCELPVSAHQSQGSI